MPALDLSDTNDAIYSGEGIVQDGKIPTSGISPLYVKVQRGPDHKALAAIEIPAMIDGTVKLTEALIVEIRK